MYHMLGLTCISTGGLYPVVIPRERGGKGRTNWLIS